MNPWTRIPLEAYEGHMSHPSVRQAQVLSAQTRDRLDRYPGSSLMLLGAAGGNGLEHADPTRWKRICCVDINAEYLLACVERHPELGAALEAIQADLADPKPKLPCADLLVADLVLEYVGLEVLPRVLAMVQPKIASFIVQVDNGADFVSESPCAETLGALERFHRPVEPAALRDLLEQEGYAPELERTLPLAGAKDLLRMDFRRVDMEPERA